MIHCPKPDRLPLTHAVGKLLLLVFVLAVLPAHAQFATEPTETEIMVRVVTSPARPADCLAPVAVTRIDGQLQTVPAEGFLIEPGLHSINGRATLDVNRCGVTDNRLRIGSVPDLEVNFEVGKTYYIAFDHRSQNTAEWSLVVWMVEQDEPPDPKLFQDAGRPTPEDDTQ
jgi:hypothetical protein